MFQENVVDLGANGGLVGIHTAPLGTQAHLTRDLCVVFTNTGIGTKIGPFRFHVELARRLAYLGIGSVRFDVSGLGDSPARVSSLSSLERGAAELHEAMETLKHKFGYSRFVFFGNCSASFRALRAAAESKQVAGILSYDTYCYPTGRSRLRRLCDLLFQAQRWKFLWRRIHLGKRIAQAGWNFGIAIKNTQGDSEWLPRDQAEALLQSCAAQGIRQIHYFSQSLDNTINEQKQFWRMYPALKPYRDTVISVKYLHEMDHLASVAEARRMLLDDMTRWIQIHFLAPQIKP